VTDAPTTTTPPVHTAALVEHRDTGAQHQTLLAREPVAVIDFYPATATNPERTTA
jgi:hypothetical protein